MNGVGGWVGGVSHNKWKSRGMNFSNEKDGLKQAKSHNFCS